MECIKHELDKSGVRVTEEKKPEGQSKGEGYSGMKLRQSERDITEGQLLLFNWMLTVRIKHCNPVAEEISMPD